MRLRKRPKLLQDQDVPVLTADVWTLIRQYSHEFEGRVMDRCRFLVPAHEKCWAWNNSKFIFKRYFRPGNPELCVDLKDNDYDWKTARLQRLDKGGVLWGVLWNHYMVLQHNNTLFLVTDVETYSWPAAVVVELRADTCIFALKSYHGPRSMILQHGSAAPFSVALDQQKNFRRVRVCKCPQSATWLMLHGLHRDGYVTAEAEIWQGPQADKHKPLPRLQGREIDIHTAELCGNWIYFFATRQSLVTCMAYDWTGQQTTPFPLVSFSLDVYCLKQICLFDTYVLAQAETDTPRHRKAEFFLLDRASLVHVKQWKEEHRSPATWYAGDTYAKYGTELLRIRHRMHLRTCTALWSLARWDNAQLRFVIIRRGQGKSTIHSTHIQRHGHVEGEAKQNRWILCNSHRERITFTKLQ